MKNYLYLLSTLICILLISGCSNTVNSNTQGLAPKVVQENKDTEPVAVALSDLNMKTEKLSKLTFTEEYETYQQVWGTLQAEYDNLKSQASLPPYDGSQIASIKNAFATLKTSLQLLNKANFQLANKIDKARKDMLSVKDSIDVLEKKWARYQKVLNEQKKYTTDDITRAVNFSKSQITVIEEKIKASEINARMQNGRLNGLYNSVEAYVKSLKT